MSNPWTGSRLDLHLDLAAVGVAKRRAALEAALREAVRDGRLRAGTPLPSSRGLAEQLGLSRGTVTSAYGQLIEEGFLTSRPGSGTVVAPDHRAPDKRAWVASASRFAPARPQHDLRPGQPDLAAFPIRAWTAVTRRVLASARPTMFGAGDPQGRCILRTALADYLGRTRGVKATADQIVITNGYHQSVRLLAQVLRAGRVSRVAAEDPGHNIFRGVLYSEGLEVAPITVDERGARVEELDDTVAAVFLTPAHQYPTGVPLDPTRRRRVIAWARATGGLIVEDDYDGEFRYDRQPVGALQGVAPEHVVYCGSVSKTLGPGLRLGWLVLPDDLVEPVVRAKQAADAYTESLGQLVLADVLSSHAYDRHVRASRLRYRRRRELLLDRLSGFPELTPQGVAAGLHVLFTLPPDGPEEADVIEACAEQGLGIRGLTELHHDPEGRNQGLMIGFAAPSEHAFPAALTAFTEAWRALSAAGTPR